VGGVTVGTEEVVLQELQVVFGISVVVFGSGSDLHPPLAVQVGFALIVLVVLSGGDPELAKRLLVSPVAATIPTIEASVTNFARILEERILILFSFIHLL